MGHLGPELLAVSILASTGNLHPFAPFFFSLAGLFVVSLVSNATPFFGASYTLVATAELITFGFSLQAFLLVVGITALGAVIGKLVIYGGAEAFNRALSKNRNVQLLARWLRHRRFLVAVFLTAVIPILPLDDYLYIAAGAAKSSLAPIVSVTIAAKVVKSTVEIWLEFMGIVNVVNLTKHFLGISGFEFSAILSVGFVILGIFLFKYDWGQVLGRQSGSDRRTGP
jgi:hypothetical protein